MAWSPDGGNLAIAAGEIIHIYDGDTIKEKQTIDAGVWTPSLAFSSDSRLLASGGRDGRVHVWDLATGKGLYTIEAHKKGVNSVTFRPHGHLLASGGNDAVTRLWDAETGQNVGQMIGGTYAVPAIAFSRNGADIAIVNGNVIRLRDVASSRFVNTIRGDVSFYSIYMSPDGHTLAVGDTANTVTIWDITTGNTLHILSTNTENPTQIQDLVWDVAFSPNGQTLASAAGDATTKLWDVSTGDLVRTLTGHSKAVTCIAFSPDGQILATGSLDSSVIFWEVKP